MRIGIAVADEPYGPFVGYENNRLIDDETANGVVPEKDRGEWECIDASPFIGADGEKYMLFTRETDTDDGNVITEAGINSGVIKLFNREQEGYTLPETGGTGTQMYTMAGLLLTVTSTVFLLYIPKKRGRRNYNSS